MKKLTSVLQIKLRKKIYVNLVANFCVEIKKLRVISIKKLQFIIIKCKRMII